MTSQVIPLRINREILETIDKLVELGVFSSRSEALRELIKLGLKNYEKIARIAQGVEKLFEQEKKEGEIPIKLEGILKEFLEERRAR